MEQLILALIRVLCPYLRAMADKTESDIDNAVVNIICGLVGPEQREKK